MRTINFCLNPVSLDGTGMLEGGQADRLISPVLRELEIAGVAFSVGAQPVNNAVNVYMSHRHTFHRVQREVAVFMSHGIADKGWRNATAGYYRATFVSGPRWSLQLLDHGAPAHRIFEVGYPKLDPLWRLRPFRKINPRPLVMWAPTHGGGGEQSMHVDPTPDNKPNNFNAERSSWWHRDEILGLLDDDRLEVIEQPHPRHRPDRQATFDEYMRADVVIGDGGSTVYEAWALNIPVVFPDWLTFFGCTAGNSVGTMEQTIYQNGIGRHAADPGQLLPLVLEAADTGITTPEFDFIEPILPHAFRGHSGRLHTETLIDLANDEPVPRHRADVEFDEFTHAGRHRRVARGTKEHTALSRNARWVLK